MTTKAILDVRVTAKTVRISIANDPGTEALTRRAAVALAPHGLRLVGPLERTGAGRWRGVTDDRRAVRVALLNADELAERRRAQLRDSQARGRSRERLGLGRGRHLAECGSGQAAWRRCPAVAAEGRHCEQCRAWRNAQARAERATAAQV